MTIRNNVEECVYCGGGAVQTEEGYFESDETGTLRKVARALATSEATRQNYQDLAQLLQNAQQLGSSAEDTAAEVRAKLPVFRDIADAMLASKGVAVAAWLSALVPVLLWLISLLPADEPVAAPPAPVVNVTVQAPSEDELHQIIERALKEQQERQKDGDHRHG